MRLGFAPPDNTQWGPTSVLRQTPAPVVILFDRPHLHLKRVAGPSEIPSADGPDPIRRRIADRTPGDGIQ